MVTLARFISDIRKYSEYIFFSAKSELKAEVIGSYLNWLWWFLDPLLFMLVYTFIAQIIFRSNVLYFPVFVFIGLNLWNLFNKVVLGSVTVVKRNRTIVSKVYLPKFVLVLQKITVNGIKMLIAFSLVFAMMLIYRVPLTWNILYILPIFLMLAILTFGIGCLVLHFGVFIDDLYNVLQVVLRLIFYLSGIFYVIDGKLPAPYDMILLKMNPVAFAIDSARTCLLYSSSPDILTLTIWTVIGILLSVCSITVIYKYENSYVKVI